MSYPLDRILLAGLILWAGCDAPNTVPPSGLVKPPPSAFAAVEAEKFKIGNVVATVTLPANNPQKKVLTGTIDDAKILRKLEKLSCQIECRIYPEKLVDEDYHNFSFAIQIEAPYRGYARVAHGIGVGEFVRSADGKYKAEILLDQPMPLEHEDKATLLLTVKGNRKNSMQSVTVETNNGTVNIQTKD